MSIFDGNTPSYNVTRPNQRHGQGDPLRDVTEAFTGIVEGTIKATSVMQGFVPVRAVRNTSTITARGISKTNLGAITPGVTPPPSVMPNTSKINLTIDTVIIARNAEPMLDEFQVDFDYQGKVAEEQGKAIAVQYDETFYIQAAKAALMTQSAYGNDAQMPGHFGGNTITLAGANDYKDPAKLYNAISELVAKFLAKGIHPNMEDFILVLPPDAFMAMHQCQYIVNGEYVTSADEKLNTQYKFAAFGVPVIPSTTAVFNKKIENHIMSNDRNGHAYNGDFTKVVCQMFSPRALMAGSTIPLTTKIFFDDLSKLHFIDSWLAYGVTVNRAEYAGAILLP